MLRLVEERVRASDIRVEHRDMRNYSPPHRYEKFIPISPIAKRRNFESDGGSEPVRSVFGLGSVTFQKRRPKRLRDWPHDWRLAHNYYQRGGGSILA